jgi:hypothetical protein
LKTHIHKCETIATFLFPRCLRDLITTLSIATTYKKQRVATEIPDLSTNSPIKPQKPQETTGNSELPAVACFVACVRPHLTLYYTYTYKDIDIKRQRSNGKYDKIHVRTRTRVRARRAHMCVSCFLRCLRCLPLNLNIINNLAGNATGNARCLLVFAV